MHTIVVANAERLRRADLDGEDVSAVGSSTKNRPRGGGEGAVNVGNHPRTDLRWQARSVVLNGGDVKDWSPLRVSKRRLGANLVPGRFLYQKKVGWCEVQWIDRQGKDTIKLQSC